MSRKNLFIAVGLTLLVLVIGLAYLSYSRSAGGTSASMSAQQVNNAIVQAQAVASTPVPTTSNPIKAATPAVDPVAATNPFNDTSSSSAAQSSGYQNPF